MGKQSRIRSERRIERARDQAIEQRFAGVPTVGEPLRILKSFHRDIQNHSSESGRRCWEYTLEILALSSGWNTESNESQKLWDRFAADSRLPEFHEAWIHEVRHAKANGLAFSEPIGDLLQEVEGTNAHLGQFLTPMSLVRLTNSLTLEGLDNDPLHISGMPTHRGLDPACGTGRFMIDALVHNANLMMHGVDLDLWMVRAAMLNVRLLTPWTTLRLKDPGDVLRPLRRIEKAIDVITQALNNDDLDTAIAELEKPLPYRKEDPGGVLVLGGRAIFIHGDALVVDLDYTNNWLCAGWAWKPHPWTWNLKMAGYPGSYDDWVAAGRPSKEQVEREYSSEIQYDYSMANKGQKGTKAHERRRPL